MRKYLTFLKNSAIALKVIEYAGIAIAITFLVLWLHPEPKPVIIQTTPKTTTVEVPVAVLETKDVIKYVQDTAEVKRLLAENAKLKLQVSQLSETIASHTSTGSGTVVTVPTPTVPEPLRPATPTPTVTRFTDWRLDFVSDGANAKYSLTQKFEVLSTVGKNDKGTTVSLVKLFEIGPGETRTEISDTKTVTVVAKPNPKKWFFSPTLQAGIGYAADSTGKRSVIGVGGVQLLKRGTSPAAEDSSLSLLTPVLSVSEGSKEAGVLPISFNLGRVKYQPFKDLWVSPYVGINTGTRTLGKVGIVFTASF